MGSGQKRVQSPCEAQQSVLTGARSHAALNPFSGETKRKPEFGVPDMIHSRRSRLHACDASHRGRKSHEMGPSHPRKFLRVAAFLAAVAALILFACEDDRRDVVSETPDTIFDELGMNAEAFEYTIGDPGGTLTLATISEPLTLNLAVANDSGSSGVLGYLFEGLTETSWLTDEVQPALAESWTRSDDGLTWIFHLRRNVTWHDGEPFTAHDVAFTLTTSSIIQTSTRMRGRPSASGSWTTKAVYGQMRR